MNACNNDCLEFESTFLLTDMVVDEKRDINKKPFPIYILGYIFIVF